MSRPDQGAGRLDTPPTAECAAAKDLQRRALAGWRFEEGSGSTAKDETGHGHDGAIVGATWTKAGVLGNALHFGGAGYVDVPWSKDFDIDGPITLIAWFRPDTFDDVDLTILSKATSSTLGYDVGLHYFNLLFSRVGSEAAGRLLAFSGGSMLDQWQQVAATYDGSIGTLYFNGSRVQQKTIGGSSGVVNADLFIGRPADRNDLYFKGDIDEVQIFNFALEASDIEALYRCVASRSPFPLPEVAPPVPVGPATGTPGTVPEIPLSTDGLVAYYPLSMSGQDASGHGNDLELKGNPQPIADRYGHANAAYSFDGADDFAIRSRPVGFPAGAAPRTIAGWFRSNLSRQYAAALFGFGAGASGRNFQLTVGPQGLSGLPIVFRVNGFGDSNDWRSNIECTPYFDEGWHHAAVTYDGNRVVLFIDGAMVATGPWTYNTDPQFVTIGSEVSTTGTWLFSGAIDDVMIFSRALSADDIATLARR